jgi:integration host factor subunit alpha
MRAFLSKRNGMYNPGSEKGSLISLGRKAGRIIYDAFEKKHCQNVVRLTNASSYAMFSRYLVKIKAYFPEVRRIMTLTKADLVKRVMENVHLIREKKAGQQLLFPELDRTPLSKKQATELVESTFEIMKKSLAQGEHVLVAGFGKFQIKFKWARKGRNPITGEQIILRSHRAVTFNCSPVLRKKLNVR